MPIILEIFQKIVLRAYHDNLLGGGHFGFKKTFEKIRNNYFWPKLRKDVKQHVAACKSCQILKVNKREIKKGLLKPIKVKSGKLWRHVQIDFMGPLEASAGWKYILVGTDHTSKYAIAHATKSDDAKTPISKIKKSTIFVRHYG